MMARFTPPMAMLCVMLCFGCESDSQTGAGAATDTPEQVLEKLSQYEQAKDFQAMSALMTERGRGWLNTELTTALLWGASAQPINPANGIPFQRVLSDYDLADAKFQWIRWHEQYGADDMFVRAAKQLESRQIAFFQDTYALLGAYFSEWDDPLEVHEINHNTIILQIADHEDARLRFVKQHGAWLLDGMYHDQ